MNPQESDVRSVEVNAGDDGSAASIPRRGWSRFGAGLVAFAVFFGGAGAAWLALSPDDGTTQRGGDSADAGDHYIALPEQAVVAPGDPFSAQVTASTNLPDGTRLEISTTDMGSCCPPVEDGRITFTTQNHTCFGPVGDAANSPGFEVTVTARPDTDTFVFPGPVLRGDDQRSSTAQPDHVLEVLGKRFEHLEGEQVVDRGGMKWLVAKAEYEWPQPQCGGDTMPLFGGPDCDPDELPQLQGGNLSGAMMEVMGMISQARMCEFWQLAVPREVEREHPWSAFAEEWRAWLEKQDFSDFELGSGWETGSLRWERLEGGEPNAAEVAIIHDGTIIASLELVPLPDYCPDCSEGTAPFWGVTGWSFY